MVVPLYIFYEYLTEVKVWFANYFLQLNEDKAEFFYIW